VERLGIGDDATVMLARSLRQLLQLSLSGNNIGPAGAAGIARHLTRLQQLDVSVNRWVAADLVLSWSCSCCRRALILPLGLRPAAAGCVSQQVCIGKSQLFCGLGDGCWASLCRSVASTLGD
jgi:hypothetical protein